MQHAEWYITKSLSLRTSKFLLSFRSKNWHARAHQSLGPKGTIKMIASISWAMEFFKLLSIEQDAFA